MPKEALEDVLYFVTETVSENTPQDETRADFIQGIHACVDKCLEKKQPFLVKSVLVVCSQTEKGGKSLGSIGRMKIGLLEDSSFPFS